MTKRQVELQARTLLAHVIDRQGRLEPKLVAAVGRAVAASHWPHKRPLLRQFMALVARLEYRQKAVVSFAASLSDEDRQVITRMLQKRHPEVVTVDWRHQPDLLTGVTAQVGDVWYDLSAQQRLLQVQEHLG
jgi:F0F1-type ATP synthase delta subunit